MPKTKRKPPLMSRFQPRFRDALDRLRQGLYRRKKARSILSPVQRLLVQISGVLVAALTLSTATFGVYALPRYSGYWRIQSVALFLSSPYYFAANEEEEVLIALRNDDAKPIVATVRLDSGSNAPNFVRYDGSNVVLSGTVREHEQKTQAAKIFFPLDSNTLGENAGLSLWASVDEHLYVHITDLPMSIAPVPWMKRVFAGLFSVLSGLSLWWSKEWWDVLRKRLETSK